MQDARWLFFDLGNTLISEERAWERRIQRLVSSLERYGRRRAIEEVRAALRDDRLLHAVGLPPTPTNNENKILVDAPINA